MENETIDEFNTKFRGVVAYLPREIKPMDASILISYIEALTSDLRYQLRDKEPADLKTTQELAEKIEKNMQSSGKSNIPSYIRETLPTTKTRVKSLNQKKRELLKISWKRWRTW